MDNTCTVTGEVTIRFDRLIVYLPDDIDPNDKEGVQDALQAAIEIDFEDALDLTRLIGIRVDYLSVLIDHWKENVAQSGVAGCTCPVR